MIPRIREPARTRGPSRSSSVNREKNLPLEVRERRIREHESPSVSGRSPARRVDGESATSRACVHRELPSSPGVILAEPVEFNLDKLILDNVVLFRRHVNALPRFAEKPVQHFASREHVAAPSLLD